MTAFQHYKIGDCWWALLWLRRIPGEHTFFCRRDYHAPLSLLTAGTQITMRPLEEHPLDGINLWIGSDTVPDFNWWQAGQPADIIGFLVEWFGRLSDKLGVPRTIAQRTDLLYAIPARAYESIWLTYARHGVLPCDILAIDSHPQSCQCLDYVPDQMEDLVRDLLNAGHSVTTIGNLWYSFDQIARLSGWARCIIGVPNGPMWPTFNVLNQSVPRYLALHPQTIDFGNGMPVRHSPDVKTMRAQLAEDGWL